MSATTRKTITCSELLWEQCEEEFKKLKEDNKKLKEENEELKQEIEEVDKILDNEDLDDKKMIRSIIKALKLQGGANRKFKQGDNYYCHNTAMEIKSLKEENEKLKNVICNPLISCNGINCRGKEKFIQYRIKEYEETIWKIENGATGMGDKN
jgi:predicted RNase H-like nuclease (RuvC/YqgF family)